MVKHYKTGLLSPIKNPGSLAENILRISNDPKLKSDLVNNAYDLLMNEFTKEKMALQTLEQYLSIIRE